MIPCSHGFPVCPSCSCERLQRAVFGEAHEAHDALEDHDAAAGRLAGLSSENQRLRGELDAERRKNKMLGEDNYALREILAEMVGREIARRVLEDARTAPAGGQSIGDTSSTSGRKVTH